MRDSISDWVNMDGLAKWFDHSITTMRRKLPGLYAEGFPCPVAAINKWYLPACEDWAKARTTAPASKDDPLMRALDDHHTH